MEERGERDSMCERETHTYREKERRRVRKRERERDVCVVVCLIEKKRTGRRSRGIEIGKNRHEALK